MPSRLIYSRMKKEIKNSFDWYKMTEQDEIIWQEIFNVLDN